MITSYDIKRSKRQKKKEKKERKGKGRESRKQVPEKKFVSQ